MWGLERATGPRLRWWSLLGLVLVPLLVSGGFLWATWNSNDRLGQIQAAIVNNDEGVKLNGQFVPLGRQLAGGLVEGEKGEPNLSWVLTDDADAAEGLANGHYAAVVTVPENFSKRATSFTKSDPDRITPAELSVETSTVSGITDAAVAQVITTAARSALNTEMTKQYLNNIYLGFNKTKEQFETVATGARKLADGNDALALGLDQASTGSNKLSNGLEQLSAGNSQLADGVTELANGTEQLPSQTGKLADGAEKAADGADQLSSGMAKFTGGLTQLNEGKGSQPGFAEFAVGAEKYVNGATQYGQLGTGVGQGVRQFDQAMADAAAGSGELAKLPESELPTLKEAMQESGVSCPDSIGEQDHECYLYLSGAAAGLAAGTGAAHAGLTTKQPGPDGKSYSLVELAKTLEDGGSQLSSNGPLINQGIGGFAGGIDQLASNGPKLASGTEQLAGGLDQLATGTDKLRAGLTKLSAGIAKLADGANQLADGAEQSATGSQQLSTGLDQLADGANKLADGSDKLATGLEKGASQVPTFDKQTRKALSSVVAEPVTGKRADKLFADLSTTTLLSVLALWLGGLTSFLVLAAVPSGTLTSMKPSWRLAGEAFLPAAGIAVIQAAAMTLSLQLLLDLNGGQVARIGPLLTVAALAFAAVNQALVGWLGGLGRMISVAVAVMFAATAITGALPSLVFPLIGWLPPTPALAGVRALASGGPGALGDLGLLLAWLLLGLSAVVLAVARRRVVRVPQPVSPLAEPVR